MVVEQHAIFFIYPTTQSLHSITRRHIVPMHHISSQLFTETNVAEGRMNLCIASWRFGTILLAHANIVSLLPLIVSGLCLDFTLLHLHTHVVADVHRRKRNDAMVLRWQPGGAQLLI